MKKLTFPRFTPIPHLTARRLRRGAGWLCCGILTLVLLSGLLMKQDSGVLPEPEPMNLGIMDRFDMAVTNTVSDALEGVLAVEKVYWLRDEDLIAPEPDPEKYGTVRDPNELDWLEEAASELLAGQELFFSPEFTFLQGSRIKYYLDETIRAVTWKMGVGRGAWTVTEVKIKHPSQIRRFFSDGTYGSPHFYTATHMARQVNAVAASSGDFHGYRRIGTVVNNGTVHRSETRYLDTCFVDDKGDLIFVPRGTLDSRDSLERFVEENGIRFSLAFGPILLEEGQLQVPDTYRVGEMDQNHSRAALCQLGELHYLVMSVNIEPYYYLPPRLPTFARQLQELGIQKAYALDGGQTATIVTGGERMNTVDYGDERFISDILYFATAIPN